MVKNPPVNAEDIIDPGLIPGMGRSAGEGHDNPLQYSCLENPMDRGAWRATCMHAAAAATAIAAKSLQSCPTLVILCSAACQAPLSMGFPRQEYWSGCPCSSPIEKKKRKM